MLSSVRAVPPADAGWSNLPSESVLTAISLIALIPAGISVTDALRTGSPDLALVTTPEILALAG